METETIPQGLKRALQAYQSKRIRQTHSDLAAMPEYSRLAGFFFDDIYGAKDFEFRNKSIRSLRHPLSDVLPGHIADAAAKIVELNDLTDELDDLLVEQLETMQVKLPLSDADYREAYRRCANREQRIYQIELLVDATRQIHNISQMWLIGISLKTITTLAHVAGIGKIMDFLLKGYEAFHATKNIRFFVDTILERELAINAEIFNEGTPAVG